MTDAKRIHFLTDVEDLGAAYRCEKCNHVTATKIEMREHRSGIVSPCSRSRLKQWLFGGGE